MNTGEAGIHTWFPCFLIRGSLKFPQPTLPSSPHSTTLLLCPPDSNSCKSFIACHCLGHEHGQKMEAIIINCCISKYTPGYIYDCSFIGLYRIEMLPLSLWNCSSKYDTSQTYLLTHNMDNISQDDSTMSLPTKL